MMRYARLTLLLLATVVLGGCFLQLPTPYIEIPAPGGFNDDDLLIPYEISGAGSSARARWTFRQSPDNGTTWNDLESREIRVPNGSAGVLQLGWWPEGLYQIEFELLTTRDRTYEVVPYLTEIHTFFVDRTAPDVFVGITENPPEGTWPGANPLDVTIAYDPLAEPSPPRLSGQRLLVTFNEPRRPVPGRDEYKGEPVSLWESASIGDTATVIVVEVDEAGNQSAPRIFVWTAN